LPIVCQLDAEGKPYLPVFLGSRMYFDLSDDDRFLTGYDRLIRNIYGRPELQKPPLGTPPAYIFAALPTQVKTLHKLEGLKQAVRDENPYVKAVLREYLETFAHSLEDFRIQGNAADAPALDDQIFDSIMRFLPYRDNFVDFAVFAADY